MGRDKLAYFNQHVGGIAKAVEYSWSCPHNNIPCGESLQSSPQHMER